MKILRCILGDQLNEKHPWFNSVDPNVHYVFMEIKPESEYATHHIQKIVGIFAAMRAFGKRLENQGHTIYYYAINDAANQHSFEANISQLVQIYDFDSFEYMEPDEYRLDALFLDMQDRLHVPVKMVSSAHFMTSRTDVAQQFEGKKRFLMESFYRKMRKKYTILMDGDQPVSGKWNYDHENRKKIPVKHNVTPPKLFSNDLHDVFEDIKDAGLNYIGDVDASHFLWPITREQALELFQYFLDHLLPYFGMYQDAMHQFEWSLYHSRISFALNIKLVDPEEVIRRAEAHWLSNQETISLAQVEGFIRQILGWREYMRGIYWAHMPEYADLNYFEHARALPDYFWTGETKMNCISQCVKQSLRYGYAHHIQRLMVTGNFCLLAGIDPNEVDAWYLGIYVDAFEWVEITNTRGMSQFADGGIVGTKPYVSSAGYIHKMGNYCTHCNYDRKVKVGEHACPFNSLYWHFLFRNQDKLARNPRMSMMYRVWDKFSTDDQTAILEQAEQYLTQLEDL